MAEDLERAALAVGVEDAAARGARHGAREDAAFGVDAEHVAEVARHAEPGCDRVREVREAAREDVAADAVGVAEVDEACGAGLQAHAREGLVDDRDGAASRAPGSGIRHLCRHPEYPEALSGSSPFRISD